MQLLEQLLKVVKLLDQSVIFASKGSAFNTQALTVRPVYISFYRFRTLAKGDKSVSKRLHPLYLYKACKEWLLHVSCDEQAQPLHKLSAAAMAEGYHFS